MSADENGIVGFEDGIAKDSSSAIALGCRHLIKFVSSNLCSTRLRNCVRASKQNPQFVYTSFPTPCTRTRYRRSIQRPPRATYRANHDQLLHRASDQRRHEPNSEIRSAAERVLAEPRAVELGGVAPQQRAERRDAERRQRGVEPHLRRKSK
jgi:hypothetical protein